MISSAVKRVVKKSFHAVGLEVHRYSEGQQPETRPGIEVNEVMPDISSHPGLQRFISSRVRHPVVLLGAARDLQTYRFLQATEVEWDWDPNVELPDSRQVVICSVPLSSEHWLVIGELKRRHGERITGIQELVLPFTPIMFAQDTLNYFASTKTVEQIAPYYLGEQWYGPIDRLNQLFPLRGQRVIEFGPCDGAQTAGLTYHEVRELVCIEARAENFIKTLIAKSTFGWNNVHLVMDDMHNADAIKYGRFDLAFCHGTYYHAISPFLFLENLISLSDNIFIGGFVLKENDTSEPLTYEGAVYRVQPYQELEGLFTSGINRISYYFHPDDLMYFFSSRGYRIQVMDDEAAVVLNNTERFYRFFASR